MVDRAVPNLPSRDFDATVGFYGAFGFTVGYRDDRWLILRRGGVQLEFFPAPEVDPRSSSFMCSVRVADLDGLHAAIAATGIPRNDTGIPRLTPIERQYFGMRVGYLVDLDGTQLHLIEDAG
ncbi:bleomycin resistance protein [Microbacterium sp. 179-B 1A2 NHS]|uniref:bleomycin resistance protein n=1 Tax=Microbacterium sp. 179-B 1A2 NHS TaxID=3142383 RepID=UPI0039A2953B